MRMRARFRRWLGIFGAASVVTLTATGAAMTVGQVSASAATLSAWTVDAGGPNLITQNTLGEQHFVFPPVITSPTTVNPVNGWSFTVTGWTAGDDIALIIGTPNGANPPLIENDTQDVDLSLGGQDSECNTPYPKGVNEGHFDPYNFVTFAPADAGGGAATDAPILEATGGATAPVIDSRVIDNPECSGPDLGGQVLLLEFMNSGPTETATVYLGFANTTPSAATLDPVIVNTGPGLYAGPGGLGAPVAFRADYIPQGDFIADGSTGPLHHTKSSFSLTVPSSATVIGETPSANSPSSGLVRTSGGDQVAQTAISNLTIGEIGGFLPPNNQGSPFHLLSPESLVYPGTVCVVLDPATNDNGLNLQFGAQPNDSVSYVSSHDPAGFAAVGNDGLTSLVTPHDTVWLQVAHDTNVFNLATWTLSNLTLGTIPGAKTYVDGPVWAQVWWSGDQEATACKDLADGGAPGVKNVTPARVDNDNIAELGYVQLATVSELAQSVYGYTAAQTSAEVVGHQFDYADNSCVGPNDDNGSIFVATDADYHDALGAAFPAGAFNTGVVLTDPDTLLTSTADIIREEGVQVVYLVGGDLAIYDSVENALASTPSYHCGGRVARLNPNGQVEDLNVIRVAGYTADDTNRLLETLPGPEFIAPTPGPFGAYALPTATPGTLFNDTGSGMSTAAPTATVENTAILVTDSTFDDAVSASALAYGWPMPLVVTPPTGLSLDALSALTDNHITQVLVLGGVDAISDTVISQLAANGISALRIAGMDGSDTSTQLAQFIMAAAPSEAGKCWTTKGAGCVGLGLDNNDLLWNYFVSRTAGLIGIANSSFAKDQTNAHAVLMARGDFYADAMTAAPLAIHDPSDQTDINAFPDYASTNGLLLPIVLTESPDSVGTALTTFFNEAGLAVSGLAGEEPADGWAPSVLRGAQENNASSNVYTIQPVGGTFALTPATLAAALAAVTAG